MSDLHLQNFVGDKAVHRERHPGRGAPMTQADRPHRDADAVAVMALERVPANIRAQGGVSRMSDPDMIDSIVEAGSGIFKSGNPAERAESRSNRCPDARELRALGRRLDARQGTFAFAHARLAWLESYGEQEAP